MGDTDAAGIIYYGAPYRWHEAALQEWLYSIGHPQKEHIASRVSFPSVHSEADYKQPLALGDMLGVTMTAGGLGRSSFSLVSEYRLAGQVCVSVRSTHVWCRFETDADNRVTIASEPLPGWLRDALTPR
jgi:YbgC/YbaW family acyl-CoA thioester hydrolase